MFVSFPGDINGDQIGDVYVSDFSDQSKAPISGSVRLHSGVDGALIHKIHGSSPREGFGTSPSDAGDVDGDGRGDLVIGAWQNADQAPSGGKIYLYSGATAKLIRTWTCRESGDTLGFDSVGIGDVDGDGRIDFLVTSAWSSARHVKGGRVFILSGKSEE